MNVQFKSTSQAVPVDGDASTVSKSQDNPSQTPDLLPGVNQLACCGDPGAMLAALVMQTAHEESKVARAQRDECERAQEAEEHAEIADLHAKADLMRAQGITDGICQMAQAAMDFTSGVKQLDAASDNLNADQLSRKNDSKLQGQVDALRESANHATMSANGWKSGAEGIGGLKSIAHGFFDAEITNKDADSKQHDMAAQTFKRMADDAHDAENDAKALLNKALDFYKEYVDTKNQTVMAAIHRA